MQTITEAQYKSLWKGIYLSFMNNDELGMGEMGAAEEEAKRIVDTWMKENNIEVKELPPLPFSSTYSEMSQPYAEKINPELEDWGKDYRFLICDLTGAFIQKTDYGGFTQAGGAEKHGTIEECIKFIQENI